MNQPTPNPHMQPFNTWEDLLAYVDDANSDSCRSLKYRAPMDRHSNYVDVVKRYKNGKLRLSTGGMDPITFTADEGHLSRFFRRLP